MNEFERILTIVSSVITIIAFVVSLISSSPALSAPVLSKQAFMLVTIIFLIGSVSIAMPLAKVKVNDVFKILILSFHAVIFTFVLVQLSHSSFIEGCKSCESAEASYQLFVFGSCFLFTIPWFVHYIYPCYISDREDELPMSLVLAISKLLCLIFLVFGVRNYQRFTRWYAVMVVYLIFSHVVWFPSHIWSNFYSLPIYK